MEVGEGRRGGIERSRMKGPNKLAAAICRDIVSLLSGLLANGCGRGGLPHTGSAFTQYCGQRLV